MIKAKTTLLYTEYMCLSQLKQNTKLKRSEKDPKKTARLESKIRRGRNAIYLSMRKKAIQYLDTLAEITCKSLQHIDHQQYYDWKYGNGIDPDGKFQRHYDRMEKLDRMKRKMWCIIFKGQI